MNHQSVLPHHQAAAEIWGCGGEAYDLVSFAISDALGHAAQRLAAGPEHQVLDVATGTGWSARNAARGGALVIGVDISADLLSAAERLSIGFADRISYRLGDAEALPFSDATFDRVISTFGVMFAADQPRSASELARVCRSGGRLVIAAWVPGGAVEAFFGVISRHSKAPPPQTPPSNWGDPDYVRSLLGGSFDLRFERGVNRAYHESCEAVWDWYLNGFGPMKAVVENWMAGRWTRFVPKSMPITGATKRKSAFGSSANTC